MIFLFLSIGFFLNTPEVQVNGATDEVEVSGAFHGYSEGKCTPRISAAPTNIVIARLNV
jgi:hypothetical protein